MRWPSLQSQLHDPPARSNPPAQQISREAYRIFALLAPRCQRLVIWASSLLDLFSSAPKEATLLSVLQIPALWLHAIRIRPWFPGESPRGVSPRGARRTGRDAL